LIEGRTTREAVNAWVVPWVEGDTSIEDPMVLSALTHLHGFDLTRHPDHPTWVAHGGGGRYLHSAAHITEELTRWRGRCDEYDADPPGWTERAHALARQAIEAERQRRDQ
jgi:hypothetical protein